MDRRPVCWHRRDRVHQRWIYRRHRRGSEFVHVRPAMDAHRGILGPDARRLASAVNQRRQRSDRRRQSGVQRACGHSIGQSARRIPLRLRHEPTEHGCQLGNTDPGRRATDDSAGVNRHRWQQGRAWRREWKPVLRRYRGGMRRGRRWLKPHAHHENRRPIPGFAGSDHIQRWQSRDRRRHRVLSSHI